MSKLDIATISNSLISHQGPVDAEQLKGKYLGIYFSAHWCPPCRGFTPVLRKTYNQLKSEGQPFEVIFVSSDSSVHDFNEYYDSMPWLAVDFKSNTRQQLGNFFGVSSIPTLIMIDPEGNMINRNGRNAVASNPNGFPWASDGSEYYNICTLL